MAKKKKNNIVRNIVLLIASAAMLVGIGFFIWKIQAEVRTTFSLRYDIEEAKKELAALQEEQEFLIDQKEKLLDDNYVKTWARGEYLITKKGEEIYKLPSQNN